MSKIKIAGIAGVVAAAAIVFASFAGAQVVPLSATCSGTVSTNVVSWSAAPVGGVGPYSLSWTGAVTGTSSPIQATYSATGTVVANLMVTDASSTVATTTCSATIASLPVVPPPPVVVPPPHLNKPQLQIDANGRFLARGMTVTSVSSGTIVATVWGNTYTINLGAGGEFLRRDGNSLPFTLSQQVNVGDEISATGIVTPSTPFIVNAGVVRDQSIVTPRKNHDDGDNNGNENEHGVMMTGSSTVTIQSQAKLQDLLKQLQSLQGLFNSRSGKGNGDGGGHGGN